MKDKQPLLFGHVWIGEGYVGFRLSPLELSPKLLKEVSSELKQRMRFGYFKFKGVEEDLFEELAQLAAAGFARFNEEKFIARLQRR
jgi:hypothetical protein